MLEAVAAFAVIGGLVWLALWLLHSAGGSEAQSAPHEPAQEQHPAKEPPKQNEEPGVD